MRLHVAGAAGVSVVAPDAAHISGALEDDEVLDAFLLQTDGGSNPTEATPDNCYLRLFQLAFTRR